MPLIQSIASDREKVLYMLAKGLIITAIFILAGCATGNGDRQKIDPKAQIESFQVIKAEIAEEQERESVLVEEGSLYTSNAEMTSLFVNPKARRIGDIVTVKIVESSKATNQASTTTGRDSSIKAGIEHFFNAENQVPNNLKGLFQPSSMVAAGFESGFKGDGTTKRSGDLTAYISARVVDRMPNGNLVVMGTREVMVNNEKQQITISGIIRPIDISSNNEIESTYISDAQISYSGTGVLNDGQRPGWLSRALGKIWPF
jgi:flagellar L-ring protein precursor FlgH